MKKYFAILLVIAMVASMLGTVTFAADLPVSDSVMTMEQSGLNELCVRNAVTHYFEDRANYLRGDVNDFITAVPAMIMDENTHRENLQANHVTFVKSEVTIDSVCCDDTRADVAVTEAVTYSANEATYCEIVNHEITVYLDENDKPLVASDAYHEECSDFNSCSVVFPAENALEPMAAGGSKLCIINIAKAEIGYTESGTNITKYGSWYGLQNKWCAIFVSWCANQANVATTIIPKTASAPDMKNTFSQKGLFYLSQSQGGSTAPQAGDLFFEGTSSSNISHVGIITSVDSNNIYVVDGNCSNKVNSHSISRSASNFVGFARPQYASTSHSAGSAWYSNAYGHWHQCANCSEAMTRTAHTFYSSGEYYVCSVCGYKTTYIDEISSRNLNDV